MKPSLIIVEGTHDEDVLNKLYPNIKTISVGGSAIQPNVIDFLSSVVNQFEFIIFCDPDHAGERIRHILSKHFPTAQHAFLPQLKAKAKSGKKIGVEHASSADIKHALDERITQSESTTDLTIAFLYELELLGKPNSQALRALISQHYHLGKPNAKTFLKRLTWLGVTQKDLIEVLNGQQT
mgnify:CR=1 FL=1